MATYVLIHGSWHGAWCWEKVIPLLRALGHRVIAPDLPGHGKDKTPIREITLNSYVECVGNILEQCDEKVILVGHSMAGVVISQMAEYKPEKIKALVYVTAFLPLDGESMFMVAKMQPPTRFMKLMKQDIKENTFFFPAQAVKDFAYNCCDDSLVEKIKPLLCVEPLLPSDTPVNISNQNFGQIPRFYIECSHDQAIHLRTQRKIHARMPCTVFHLHCDHSPFFSGPNELVDILTQKL